MIPAAIEAIFGNKGPKSDYSGSVIVLRHGFNSNNTPFKKLEGRLRRSFANATVNNDSYTWTDPVIENGVKLALVVLQNFEDSQPLILIGHSMGGLVCRVANVALTRTADFQNYISALLSVSGGSSYLNPVKTLVSRLRQRDVSGLITLATPNSATLTNGQIASLMKLSSAAAIIGFPNKTPSFVDLTTDRLFRILQHFQVKTPTLSVSGSAHSLFAKKSGALGAVVGLAAKLAVPNDGLVEDRSVDLKASILPNEICHMGSAKYLHLRAYSDCTDVTHSSIYDDMAVYDALCAFIEKTL